MNAPLRRPALASAPFVGLALIAVAGGCYTYNIYQLDGDGGAGSTSSTSDVSSSAEGSSGSAGGASGVTATAESVASSTAESSSSSGTPSCSQGFPPPTIVGTACDMGDMQPTSFFVSSQVELDQTCFMQRNAGSTDVQTPFNTTLNGFRIRTACSEWTPGGYGPFTFRRAEPIPSQRFVIVLARLDFQKQVTQQFHGAGVMLRPDADPSPTGEFALISLLRDGATMRFQHYVWDGTGSPSATQIGSIDATTTHGAVALCFDQTNNNVKAYATDEIAPSTNLVWNQVGPAAGATFFMAPPFQIGAIAHAFDGGEEVDVLVQGLGVNFRTTAGGATCEANLPMMF